MAQGHMVAKVTQKTNPLGGLWPTCFSGKAATPSGGANLKTKRPGVRAQHKRVHRLHAPGVGRRSAHRVTPMQDSALHYWRSTHVREPSSDPCQPARAAPERGKADAEVFDMWPLWERAESHHCLVPSTVPEPGCLGKSGADKPIKEQLGGKHRRACRKRSPPTTCTEHEAQQQITPTIDELQNF